MYGQDIYGTLLYFQNIFPSDQEIELIYPDLMQYLPKYYLKSLVMKNLQDSFSKELAIANYNIQDIVNQLFVDTATWGLELWERELKITTDVSKPYEYRRSFIKAKIRGVGTTTKNMLKNTALAYTNAEVDIIENFNDYSFVLKFVGVKGIPLNMAPLIETIEEIKPAHLNYSFEYTYTWWYKLKELTWASAGLNTWNELKVY